jgi:hypothetical protein
MQHELNLQRMESYSFYCQEKGLPDFLTMKKKDLPKIVHFEIVGSKGVLGEERRAQQMITTTQLWLSNPLTANLLNLPVIMIDGYEDAGVKGAEEYVRPDSLRFRRKQQAQIQQLTQAELKQQPWSASRSYREPENDRARREDRSRQIASQSQGESSEHGADCQGLSRDGGVVGGRENSQRRPFPDPDRSGGAHGGCPKR